MFYFILLIYILPSILGVLWFLNFVKLIQNLILNKEILVQNIEILEQNTETETLERNREILWKKREISEQKVFGSLLIILLILSLLYSISQLPYQSSIV